MKLAKKMEAHKIPGIIIIRLGIVLTILVSLIGFMGRRGCRRDLGTAGSGMNADVYALIYDSDGNLVAGGSFTSAGGSRRTALRNGTQHMEPARQRHERRNLRPGNRQ